MLLINNYIDRYNFNISKKQINNFVKPNISTNSIDKCSFCCSNNIKNDRELLFFINNISFRSSKPKSEFLDLPRKEIYAKIQNSLKNLENKLGFGGSAEVWKIEGTDYCVRIPYSAYGRLNSGFTRNLTKQDKANHAVAKMSEGVTIMPLIKGYTYFSKEVTNNEVTEYIEDMPQEAFTNLFKQAMEAHYCGLKFDTGWKNVIVNPETQTLTAIDFYKPFDGVFNERLLSEIYLSLTAIPANTQEQRRIIAGKLLLAPIDILLNEPEYKIDLKECGFPRFLDTLEENRVLYDGELLLLKRWLENINPASGDFSQVLSNAHNVINNIFRL